MLNILKRVFRRKTTDTQTHVDSKSAKLPTTLEISEILRNIKDHVSYYAGGTLCVDKVMPGDVLMFNLDGKCFAFSGADRTTLSVENRQLVFSIYKEHKGETDHYTEELNKFESR